MSKEAMQGDHCACGQRIAFMQYHWPHCRMNPNNLSGELKAGIEARFQKAELAQIATHGPMADKPFGKKRQKGAKPKLKRRIAR